MGWLLEYLEDHATEIIFLMVVGWALCQFTETLGESHLLDQRLMLDPPHSVIEYVPPFDIILPCPSDSMLPRSPSTHLNRDDAVCPGH